MDTPDENETLNEESYDLQQLSEEETEALLLQELEELDF